MMWVVAERIGSIFGHDGNGGAPLAAAPSLLQVRQ
jgi:hypothetical protein